MKLLLIILAFVSITVAAGAAVFVTNTPSDKDAFVRALAPTLNYGGAGALSVSGTNSTSPLSGATNGAFDTFISFNTGAMVTSFNSTFGPNNWVITSATLNLTETAPQGNAIFNSGSGMFEVRWIANDTWVEGSGTPMTPTTNGITYNEEPSYLNSNTDTNLGAFDFLTANTNMSCPLALPASFVANMQAGGEVGLFMTAIDPGIGFVFYSRSFNGNPTVLPQLIVSATAQPGISAISLSGTDLVLSATNGVAGGTYYVLTSTNLAAPPGQWTPIETNVLAGSGDFTITVTNAASVDAPSPQFFVLQTY
jgi:hypothetical protein